ncbi:hypothetical protein [Siccibacter turicensis]|uniref:hypothetical protein n=1 Tax=Siccibacter turicensis TaxID=357233 RepID=UPI000688C7AD|nr:hypothetical protein [Siccibacter turicensis]
MRMAGSARVVATGFVMVMLISGCAQRDARRSAEQLAQQAGFTRSDITGSAGTLASWRHITPPVTMLRVYIEGDGFAWASRTRPSDDPTPHNPVGLKLALADPTRNVLYLARPCQLVGPPLPAGCQKSAWTDKRFSPELINAINHSLDQAIRPWPDVTLELVGYSGGAAIAAQLAARRSDVVSLRSVAGNLDVAYVNQLHKVTPMPDAAGALEVAPQLSHLPQVHYSGEADNTVPPEVAARFQRASGSRCVITVRVPEMTHGSDWAARWPALLQDNPLPPAGCATYSVRP